MNGEIIKKILAERGFSQRKVAEMIGESQQNLNSALQKDDIKTGLLERISQATDIPLAVFYGDVMITHQEGDGSTAVTGTKNNISSDAERIRLLEKLLEEKERTIQILMSK